MSRRSLAGRSGAKTRPHEEEAAEQGAEGEGPDPYRVPEIPSVQLRRDPVEEGRLAETSAGPGGSSRISGDVCGGCEQLAAGHGVDRGGNRRPERTQRCCRAVDPRVECTSFSAFVGDVVEPDDGFDPAEAGDLAP